MPFHSPLQLFPALPNAGLSQAPKVDVPRDNWSHSEMRIASSVITQVGTVPWSSSILWPV